MNIKKLFAVLAGVSMLAQTVVPSAGVFGAEYSEELQGAYNWAYSKGVTTMSSIDNANMYGAITRAEMAKMLSVYAESSLGITADTSKACTFTDIDSVKGDLHDFIIKSCQLGIMGQGITAFRPYDTLSRAEFGTALSRVLWGDKYEGGTPYYANHLNALKAAGIMNQIANAESTKEVRGYVMLMLQRSEGSDAGVDCDDPVVALACSLDTDECPAACKGDSEKEETVVKSGDLAVKATAATEKKAILDGGVSDLDTITLKASEKITVNSITLERFGYSTVDDVDAIWLEDGDGNKIADEKSLSSTKDTVTLKIKKEYREMDASNALTIVLRTANFLANTPSCYEVDANNNNKCTKKAGSTIGFKVTGVDASAKNLDISDYNPYTYELVSYDGSKVTVAAKGNDKKYNYEEKEFYEVSRLKVQAGSSIVALNGITLTNKGTYVAAENANNACTAREGYTATHDAQAAAGSECTYKATALDLTDFVSDVKVTADGKEVKGLKYNVTKDNELVLNWDTIEVEINKNVQIAVSIAMEGLDEFGKVVRLELADSGDLNATEKKTGARVSVTAPTADSIKSYIFEGSKIKFSNTKLSSTIDAAQGSEDVVIAQGKITVGEEVKLTELVFNADKASVIDAMSLTIAGETFDASISNDTANDVATFTFKNVTIEKSGDFEISVDVIDNENYVGQTVNVTYGANNATSISKNAFAANNGRYETSREYVKDTDVSGSISISKLKVQESKASLKNNDSKTVEFVKDETSDRVTVFKGSYTAKKSDITLKEFALVGDSTTLAGNDTTAEFYLYVDGEEVGMVEKDDIVATQTATAANFDGYENFSDNVEVAAGKSVNVEIKAVISPSATSANINLDLYLRGEDKNGTNAGFAKAGLTTFKFVLNGSLTISDSTTLSKSTVVLQENDITVAKFTLKPSKSDSVKLDNLVFDLSKVIGKTKVDGNPVSINDITVEVDGTELEVEPAGANSQTVVANNIYQYDATDVDDVTEEVEVIVKVTGLDGAAVANNQSIVTDPTSGTTNAIAVTLKSVNSVNKNSAYTRLVLPSIVKFDTQKTDGSFTTYTVNVEDYDGAQIENLKIYTVANPTVGTTAVAGEINGLVSDGATFDAPNKPTAETVKAIYFEIKFTNSQNVAVTNKVLLNSADYSDFFKVTDGTTLRVYKAD